jgi:hypothetical protein
MRKTNRRGPPVWVIRTAEAEGWVVREQGNRIVVSELLTQRDAIALGWKLARRNQSELIVQSRRGRIRIKNTYGRDPYPPRG